MTVSSSCERDLKSDPQEADEIALASTSASLFVAVTSSSTASTTTFVSSGVTLYGSAAAAALAAEATASAGTNTTEKTNTSGKLSTLAIVGESSSALLNLIALIGDQVSSSAAWCLWASVSARGFNW